MSHRNQLFAVLKSHGNHEEFFQNDICQDVKLVDHIWYL